MYKKIHINEKNYKKIIVVSDIHAHFWHFDKLLQKLQLQKNELLIINGDFINRGEDSLKMIHILMDMDKAENIILLSGNHEYFILDFFRNKEYIKHLPKLINSSKYTNLVKEMYAELKMKNVTLPTKDMALAKLLQKRYKRELDFLANLPFVVEGKEHIVVHSGYEAEYAKEPYLFLKNDDYAYTERQHEKMIIIGHNPVCNLRQNSSNFPYYQRKNNIYAIDGGLGVLTTGELNALIIEPKAKSFNYDILQINDFKPMMLNKTVNFLQDSEYRAVNMTLPLGALVEVVRVEGKRAQVKYKHQFYWVDSAVLSLNL